VPALRPPVMSIARASPRVPTLPNANPSTTLSATTTTGRPSANAKPDVESPNATSASANCRFARSARYAIPTGTRDASCSAANSEVRRPMSDRP